MDSPINPHLSTPQPPYEQLSLPAGNDVAAGAIPFAQLGHSNRTTLSKPVVLTVIGILELVLSAVGGMICLWCLLMSLGTYMVSNMSPGAFSMAPASGTMTLTNQVTVASTLGSMHPLDAQQQQSLSIFLSTEGDAAFPSGGRALSAPGVRLSVLGTSVEKNLQSSGSGSPAVIYTLATGMLRVAEDETKFTPTPVPTIHPGDASVVDSTKTLPEPGADAATDNGANSFPVQPGASPVWQTAESANIAQSLVADAQAKIAPQLLTPAQLNTLKQTFTPSLINQPPLPPDSHIDSASVANSGDLIVVWSNSQTTNSIVIDAAGHSNGTAIGSNPLAIITQKNSPGTLRNAVLASVGNLLLMCYLFVIGIIALSGSRGVRGPHLIYALLQIPLAIYGSIATMTLMNVFNRTTTSGPSPASTMYAVVLALIVCAYPISLLFLMNTQSVRRYVSAK